MKPVVKTS